MPKQLNVNLAFTADTREAKAQLASLQQDLNKLTQTVGSKSPLGITKDLSNAIGEVNKLQAALTKATTSSGNLDLGQFRKELGTANLDAHKIAETLNGLGPEGQAAFAKLAQSVTLAEVPIKKVNNTLSQFATTLANTARWQISSSVLHGFVSALQNAYRYAQDLNNSLNSIRIVTGQSTDQMAQFAKQANESAKALSATTTAYTDASLIFFQQGLTGEAVTERTDAVIKMSNVTGDSVEDVASYMTAIWNNFDDGSQKLEHFADVITALGAATASSSAEISAGLEKFASIAGTVGLSYEYATSALATVVATTRQSADTVGTAFKTLFARLQGLKLGETLEDGVDLNKYSQALDAVGVQVLDLSGEMRALDDILDDLAARWKFLSSAQQTALAQTVAGTRQYNQLVALMSNWDFMEENLKVARNAEGSLQEQADIYAESWEAASKRVKAAWQEIYAQLLDDKFFINLTNGSGKVLDEISNVIDAFGGLKGIVPLLGTSLLSLFGKQLSDSLNNFIYNLQLAHGGMEAIVKERQAFNQELVDAKINTADPDTASLGDLYQKQGNVQNELIQKTIELQKQGKVLSSQEEEILKLYLDQNNALIQQYEDQTKLVNAARDRQTSAEIDAALNVEGSLYGVSDEKYAEDLLITSNNSTIISAYRQLAIEAMNAFKEGINPVEIESSLKEIEEAFEQTFDRLEGETDDENIALASLKESLSKNLFEAIKGGEKDVLQFTAALKKQDITLDTLINSITGTDEASKKARKTLEDYKNSIDKTNQSIIEQAKAFSNAKVQTEEISKLIKSLQGNTVTFADKFIAGTRAVSTFGMTLSSITGLIDTWTNPDTSGIDKFIASLTTLGMVIPMLNSVIKSLNTNLGINLLAIQSNTAAVGTYIKIKQGEIATVYEDIAAEKISNLAKSEQIEKLAVQVLGEEALTGAKEKGITVDSIKLALEQKGIKLSAINLGALIKRILGEEALNEELKKQIALETILKGIAGFGIAGAAVIIAGAVAAVKIYNKHLENTAKKSKEAADGHKELTDKISDESKKITDLIDKYKELRTQEESGKISQANLKDQIIALSEEYNDQRIAILGLSGAYDELDIVINNLQNDIDEKLFTSSGTDVLNYISTLNKELRSLIKTRSDNFGKTIDLEKMVDRNDYEQAFAEELTAKVGINFINSDHIYTEDLINAIVYYKDELDEILAKYSNLDAAQQILGYMKELSDDIDNVTESLNRYQESALKLAFNQNFNKNNFNLLSFMNQMLTDNKVQMAKLSEEQVRDWVLKQISGIDEVADYAQAYQISLTLYDENATEEQLDNLAEQIKNFSDSEKSWIILHPHIAEDYTTDGNIDIEKISERFQNQLAYEEYKNIATQARSFMSEFAQEGTFSNYSDIEKLLGIDISNLAEEDIYSKLNEIYDNSLEKANQFWTAARTEAENYALEVNEKLSESIKFSDEDIDAFYAGLYGELTSRMSWTLFGSTDTGLIGMLKDTDYVSDFREYAEALINEIPLTEDLIEKGERLRKVFGDDYITELIDQVREFNPDVSDLEAKIDEINQTLENIHENSRDFIKDIEDAQAAINRINGSIDDLQAAYKEFAAAEKEYNEKGYYSVDTIQSLLKLSPEYLQFITVENGQIKTLTGDIQNQQTAYYDLLEAKYADYFLTQARILAEEDENSELYIQTLRTWELNFAQATTNTTLDSAIGIVKGLAEASGEAAGAYENLISTMEKFEDILGAGRNGLGVDFEGAMNATPKGGSSGSTDRKDVKEYLKEFDRLYSIKKALEDIADVISDLNKEEEHLVGRSLAEALEKENELLAQQKDLYLELLDQQSNYRDELAGALQQYGATFDYTTGNLTNYLEITQGALDKYNAAVEAYNSSHDKGAFSIAEQEYEYFKEVLSAYQEILTDMQETQNNLDDNFLKQIENNLKGFEADIKVNLDFEEARRKVNNFFKEIGNNFKKVYKSTEEWVNLFNVAADNVTTYTEASGTIATDLKAIQEVAEYLNNEGYKNPDENSLFVSRDDAINKYKELTEQLMSDAHDLYDLYEDTWNNYLDAIDEVKSQWSDILKGFDRVANTLKHYEKITNLLYGGDQIEAGRAYLDQIYSATSASSLARQDVLRKEIDALQKEYDQILASGVAETDKDLVELKEAIQDAESSLESEIENYLDVIQNQLTNSIKSIMNTADKLMTNDRGINPVIERWNDSRDAAEGYYDEVERVYELERMESLWEDAISKTSTLKNQQYLTNIMNEQLKNLREKTKLSEYDIGLAEKELQIYQAQMALEDARANKNAMKLVRNEQGNWAYQYVTDEDDIASKEEDLLNSLYEKYEYVKNANIQATEDLLQLYQTAQERLTALLEEYKVADEARRAEITEEYEYLYNYYYGPEGLIIQKATETHAMEDDLNIAGMELLWDLYETDIENYDLMIESEKALIDALRDHDIATFRELIEAVATGDNSLYNQLLDKVTQVTDDSRTEWEELAHDIIANWATNPDSVKNIIVDAYNSIMLKVAEYDYAIALSEYKSGVAWSNITDHVLLAQWAVDSVYDSVWNVINQTDGLNDFRNRINAIGDAWNLVAQNIANATSQMTGFLQLLGVSAQVNIPDYQKLLNPIASTKTFTADPSGGNGNNTSSFDDNKQQYRLVGHDNYGHETAWLLTGSSEEDVLNQMVQQFANDRGEMGNYYQSYLNGNNTGGWTIVPVGQSRALLATNGNSISNYSNPGMKGVRTGPYASNASLLAQMYDQMRLEAASMGVDVSSYYSNMPIVSPYEDPSSALYGSTLINNRNNNDNANSTTYNYNFESVNVQADDMDTFLKSIDYYCGKHEI